MQVAEKVTEKMKEDFAKDGAIVVRNMFTPAQLEKLRAAFDYGIANPSPAAQIVYAGTDDEHFNEYGNPAHIEKYLEIINEFKLAEYAAQIWGSEHVWFIGEELFIKKGGKAGRSPWHQDTSYMPANGPHLMNFWISFEKIPKKNSLEFVRGSHNGPQYDGTSYTDHKNPTLGIWNNKDWPRLPDVEKERVENPDAWDIISFDVNPGDVLVFHSGLLHGGAPVSPDCPDRHTLVLRFFGDKIYYRPFPTTPPNFKHDIREIDDRSMTPGQEYHPEYYVQLV